MTLKFRQLIQTHCRARNANSKMQFWSRTIKSISAARRSFAAFLSEGDSHFQYNTERCRLNLRVQFPTVTSTLRTEGMWEATRRFSGSSRTCLISSIQGFNMVHCEKNPEQQIQIKFLLVLLELCSLRLLHHFPYVGWQLWGQIVLWLVLLFF